ncbi:MAG: hypothetical protein QGI13_17370, partial [Rhodospirillales bacterium]|nr:hypothetical protein [Rhodospirillales bacterium]
MTRQRTSLSFDLWPQDDRTLWQRACQTGAFLEPDGPASHWAEATRKQVTKGCGHRPRRHPRLATGAGTGTGTGI